MHRHAPGELYYAIEGEFAFYTGGFGTPAQRIAAGPGQVVPLVGGTPHTVRNETDEDAVALVVHAPGPPMENFSRAVAAASVGSIPDMNEGLAIAQRHGIELLRPIPALQR
jgi:mannose-6-phosphate isomerase-like protein (cupin superfamily)